jgi:hypothetical protein
LGLRVRSARAIGVPCSEIWNGGTRPSTSLAFSSLKECGLRHSHSTVRGASVSEVMVTCGGRSADQRTTSPGIRSPPERVTAGTRRGTRPEKLSFAVSSGLPARSTCTSSNITHPSARPWLPASTKR